MEMLSVAEALNLILKNVRETEIEHVPLVDAGQRVLAEDLKSKRTTPPFTTSAMDGYAVLKKDIENLPATLKIIGEARAGTSFPGQLRPGECVRILTGAPLPSGANHVVIQEDVKRSDNSIEIKSLHSTSSNLRNRGSDFEEGEVLLKKGRHLDTRAIMLAAAMAHPILPVRKKPTIAILATGDELVEPGQSPLPDQIICSNSYGLLALVNAFGADGYLLGIAEDNEKVLKTKFLEAKEADVIVTSGGVSVGDYDKVGPTLLSLGGEIKFWNIAMRPGKPMLFCEKGAQKILGVPGNPISALICARLFLVPLIERLLGRNSATPLPLRAKLTRPLDKNGSRQHYLRAYLSSNEEGECFVTPQASQDSSLVRLFAQAQALILRKVDAPSVEANTEIEVIPLDF